MMARYAGMLRPAASVGVQQMILISPERKAFSMSCFCLWERPAWWKAMPRVTHLARRLHCVVGFERALRTERSSFSRELEVVVFLLMSSAAFSAPRLVLTKTRACFPFESVSSAILRRGLVVASLMRWIMG